MENKYKNSSELNVTSEIGCLKKVLVHSPDGGIGNVPTSKLHDWLYDDIVDVGKIQDEYHRFQVLLLLFLEPETLFKDNAFVLDNGKLNLKTSNNKNNFETNPEKLNYFLNDTNINDASVLDTQFLLQYLFSLKSNEEKTKTLIENICSIEDVHNYRKTDLLAIFEEGKKNKKYYIEAVKTLLTGKLEYQKKGLNLVELKGNDVRYIFPPVPNFIFTRDIGVTIGNYLLITKPRFYIRKREVILMRFIAENFIFKNPEHHFKIIDVSEDDDFFQVEKKDQEERRVNYEGGDIMMISKRHLLIGCSERTSPHAIQKLITRIFWEDTGIEIISVIKISEKRSQMHIDTVFSHFREDAWFVHSPLSEEWHKQQENKEWYTKNYINELSQKSADQIEKEKDVTIFQFYLHADGIAMKKKYDLANELNNEQEKRNAKSEFKKINFLLKPDKNNQNKYYIEDIKGNKKNVADDEKNCKYVKLPNGLEDLLKQISKNEFGKDNVKFIYSGGGEFPHDGREQWTDACNLLILKSGVAIGYDRNNKTALEFNVKFKDEPISGDKEFITFITEQNKERFDNKNDDVLLDHIIHVDDLIKFIIDKHLGQQETIELINSIKNTLILISSYELSRARGGSHCMSMPLFRD